MKVLVEGTARARITSFTDRRISTKARRSSSTRGRRDRDRGARPLGRLRLRELREAQQKISPEVVGAASQIEDYSKLADTVASHLATAQEMLATLSVRERLEKAMGFMEAELRCSSREAHPQPRQRQMGRRGGTAPQRADEGDPEGARRRRGRPRRAERARRTHQEDQASKEAREKANAELKKLKTMSPMSAEATVAQLSRLAAVDPQGKVEGQVRSRRCRDARRRPFRPTVKGRIVSIWRCRAGRTR